MSGPPPGDAPPPLRWRLYNPHRLRDKDLERSFIARRATFRAVLADITGEAAGDVPQHHLVVGQRGMGKSTLLRRLGLELRRDPHRAGFVPLQFPEEQYVEVDRLSKFWLNCLDALADTLETERASPVVVDLIDGLVRSAAKAAGDEPAAEAAAREAFTRAWHTVGRRPVLLIDNFNLLLNRLKKHDFELRGYFTAAGAPVLVGACTDLSDRTEDYGAAFYDGFKTHWLKPLTLAEMREVIEQMARESGRTDLLNRLPAEVPRLATLRELTGGNPRTAVLLFDLFSGGFSADAYEDLEHLLDVVTPLYQSKLDQLSDQAQVIVGTLARRWAPMASAEVCESAGLEPKSVSPQLGRLRDAGWVEEVEIPLSKKTGYQLAERLFNVWYLMRFATRRLRTELESLTRFVEVFHTPAERDTSARQLLGSRRLSHGQIAYGMALAGSLSDSVLADEVAFRAQCELVEQMQGVRERIREILDPADIEPRVFEFVDLRERLRKVVPAGSPMTGPEFADLVLGSPALLPGGSSGETDRNVLAASALTPERVVELTAELRQEASRLTTLHGRANWTWLQSRLQRGLVTSWENAEEISRSVLDAANKKMCKLLLQFAGATPKRNLSESAFEKVRQFEQPVKEGSASAWFNWGYDLHVVYVRPAETEGAYREAAARDPKFAHPWNNLGNLFADLGRPAEAEGAYREAAARDPKYAYPWNGLGNLLADLGRPAEAEGAYREAAARDPKYAHPWNGLGNLLADLGRPAEAEGAYREAAARDPKFAHPWNNLGNLLQTHLGRYAEAEEAYRKAIARDPKDASPLNGLGCLLYDHAGRFEDAQIAFERSLELDAAQDDPRHNLAYLFRDCLGDRKGARRVLSGLRQKEIGQDTQRLHEAVFAAYEDNWGAAMTELKAALSAAKYALPPRTRDDWFRASAVLLQLGFGEKLVAFLEAEGADVKMLPWFAAVRAHALGDRKHLLSAPVEARPTAETIYDQIQVRRERLAEAWRKRPDVYGKWLPKD